MLCCRARTRVRLAQSCRPREGGDPYPVTYRWTAAYGSRASLTLARDDRKNCLATTVEKWSARYSAHSRAGGNTALILVPAARGRVENCQSCATQSGVMAGVSPAMTTKSGIAAISS
jgi:hypothetical protein